MGIENEPSSGEESGPDQTRNETTPLTPEEQAALQKLYQVADTSPLDSLAEQAQIDVDKILTNADGLEFDLEAETLSVEDRRLIAEYFDPDFDRNNITTEHLVALFKDPDMNDSIVAGLSREPLTEKQYENRRQERQQDYESVMRSVGRKDEDRIDPQLDTLMANIRAEEAAKKFIRKASE